MKSASAYRIQGAANAAISATSKMYRQDCLKTATDAGISTAADCSSAALGHLPLESVAAP